MKQFREWLSVFWAGMQATHEEYWVRAVHYAARYRTKDSHS